MSWDPDTERALDRLLALVAAAAASAHGGTPVVLIDGPSGAGKSSLAGLLLSRWPSAGPQRLAPARIVRMDDLYPGWDGLDAASSALHTELLEPLATSGRGRWRRWDWAAARPAEWHELTGTAPVLVEGCGTLAGANTRWAHLAIWLDADDRLRKERALYRDGATFASHWDQWQSEFERYLVRENPRANADLVLDVTDWPIASAPRRASGTTVVP
ncbi:ATP-binding protein [Leifsonia shinshuensis]|uniref:ATP-binding protein n=1 Tax=Leifsonia shinshuensis TaxID=150026 RepID=UPI001F50E8B0|nr:ATP-binding protein [Leifsonia shinshuensis]MCI0155297.1 ATP-binding protein [Leifsonia shinshuensis]